VKIVVIGVGHVGLVSAACFAEWGHEVVGMDDDAGRILGLNEGVVPFYEPGLEELVAKHRATGCLTFDHDLSAALDGADAAFVCVGTPSLPGGGPNLTFVERVGRNVAALASGPLVLVEKSTVPVNTGQRLGETIAREQGRLGSDVAIRVASNPEFLREGNAVEDTLHPDRVVIGVPDEEAAAVLRAVYAPLVEADGTPMIVTDVATAELVKHASNAFLATKISFINAVARICELTGADVDVVAQGMGLDARIGPQFLRAGIGYGGSCFPKDVDAFAHIAADAGYRFELLEQVRRINVEQRGLVLEHLRSALWHLDEKIVTLLGAAFKPGTDDLREAPAVHLARALLDAGATVRVYDPVALPAVARELPEVERFDDPIAALEGAHAAIVATEWPEVRELTPKAIAAALGYPVLIDGRNVFDPAEAVAAGLWYRGIGRPVPDPTG
jgi:UDPglucose 6-dehydrogenase